MFMNLHEIEIVQGSTMSLSQLRQNKLGFLK